MLVSRIPRTAPPLGGPSEENTRAIGWRKLESTPRDDREPSEVIRGWDPEKEDARTRGIKALLEERKCQYRLTMRMLEGSDLAEGVLQDRWVLQHQIDETNPS